MPLLSAYALIKYLSPKGSALIFRGQLNKGTFIYSNGSNGAIQIK